MFSVKISPLSFKAIFDSPKVFIIINSSAVRKQKEMENIKLNYFTGHTKKIIHVFHSIWDFFDMIFITVIQPKRVPEVCFHRVFILICFRIQNSFLSGRNSKKQSHIFFLLNGKSCNPGTLQHSIIFYWRHSCKIWYP